jgi:magnesium chelatase subunit H
MERFNAHVWDAVAERIAADAPDVKLLRFHDGHVEQRDPALAQAIAEADVLFITLINMRGLADWLGEQVSRSPAQAVFAFESMPEVMALNRVGDYRITGGRGSMPKPMQAILKLITRGRDEDTLYAYMKLTRVATKLLPLMPPKLKDFRTWLTVNIYWNQPDAENISQMIRLILRDCLGRPLSVGALRPIPTMGCFHPQSDTFFDNPAAFLRWYERRGGKKQRGERRPLVALIAFRKHVVQRQRYHADLITALEAAGLDVLPLFVSGIEMHVAVREWLTPNALNGRHIDLLINSMGFPLVGGPAGSTKPGQFREQSAELLSNLDVPYMIAQPLQMQNEAEWRERGVAPMQAVIMYDLPEMDGSIAPITLGAIRGQEIVATPDRLARAARQAAGWTRLRRTPPAKRRIAFVLYNFPPGLGKLATAALLDVPASLHAIMQRMRAEGYDTGSAPLPASPSALAQQLSAIEANEQPLSVSRQAYRTLVPLAHADRIDAKWGAPPGEIAPHGRDAIRVDGITFGNLFVGLQPPMGIPGDPMRLLFDRDFTPHHQYVAFYRWLAEEWRADAIVHVGMHGTAEWMPGLQLGLTADCWPDLLLGDLPHLYLYPLNNPAEAALAKRRGYAAIVSHLVPPYARAGLYKQLANARAEIDRLIAQGEAPEQIDLRLPDLPQRDGESGAAYLKRASTYLDLLEQRLILDGLHIFGAAPGNTRAAALIEAALDVPRNGRPGLAGLLNASGVPNEEIATARAAFVQECVIGATPVARFAYGGVHIPAADADAMVAEGRGILSGLAQAPGEINALLHALGGGYLRPAAGADPVRSGAGALPSGRNIHGIDPWRLPSDGALARGAAMAEALIVRHGAANGGAYPQTVGLALWALDTIKSEGESLGVALALVGARPERDGQGKIWRYALVPLAELGRPRIDLLLDISSIFRDTFQLSLDLLDDLFRRAAAADEPPEQNPIRAHALAMQAQGASWEAATARIFTQAPGRYGTGVDERIDESAWESAGELADTYVRRSSHTYGGGRAGAPAPAILRGLLGSVDHVFQAIDSVEYGLTDMQHYYGHSGAVQLAVRHERGAAPPLTYAESTAGTLQLNSAAELIQIEARSKILNPRWYEAMLSHGFAGAAEIGNRFTYLLGWGATSGAVAKWVYDDAAATFVLDEAMRQRIEAANPRAARNAVARLLEAHGRGLWEADDATIERLQAIYGDLEDRLEGALEQAVGV